MTWFILSLIAILFWSGSDLFSKLGSRPDDKYSHWKMVMAVGVVMGAHAFFLIATGTPFSISDIVTYLPASAMYILSMILGYALRRREGDTPDKKHTRSFLAILFPILYCIIDGLGTFADALLLDTVIAEEQANIAYELTFLMMAVFAFVYVVIVKKQKISLPAEKPKLAAALCETAGQFAYVFAIGANAIVAAPMISSYCIMSLVWSRIFLKEKLSKAQYAVIAVAAVGIAILGME